MSQDEARENNETLTLPVLKTIDSPTHMTRKEKIAFRDNDPVAGTEFEEMATLFLQMHDLVCSAPAEDLRVILDATDSGLSPLGLQILQARSQALVDNTRSFTRAVKTG